MITRLISRKALVAMGVVVITLTLILGFRVQANQADDGRINKLPWVNSWGAVAAYCVDVSGGPDNNLPGGGVVVLNASGQRVLVIQRSQIATCLSQLKAVSQLTSTCRDQIRARGLLDTACREQIKAAQLENLSNTTLAILNNDVCILRHSPPVVPGVPTPTRTPRPLPGATPSGPALTAIYNLYIFTDGSYQLNSLPDDEGKTLIGHWQGCG
jgi:hypothetical protein